MSGPALAAVSSTDAPQPPATKPRRIPFTKAVRDELKSWRRLSQDDESLLLAFCACVSIRMQGLDPQDILLP